MSTIVLVTRVQWAKAIRESWSEQVEGFIATGRLITEAKAALPHGEFIEMVKADLPFGRRTAQMLMAVAANPVLSKAQHVALLPPSWGTLYELSRLPDDRLLAAIKAGEITPETERRDAMRLLDSVRRPVSTPTGDAETCTVEDLQLLIRAGSRFHTIYVDPPWQYGNQSTRAATDRHYDTMSIEELHALPVASLADENAHLHLWTTNGFLREAIDLMPVWGFEFKSCFVWTKPSMGIGNYWRVSHEFLLFGLRGTLPFGSRSLMSWATLDRGRHSAKPEAVRQMVEQSSPAPRLELFGRRPADGWTVWGNEIARSALGFDDDVPALVEENT